MSESQIMQDILVAVSALPETLVWRHNTGIGVTPARTILRAGLVGSADIIGVSRGRAIAIEVKTPTGKQSEHQRKFEAAWRRAGGQYVLARSVSDALAALQ